MANQMHRRVLLLLSLLAAVGCRPAPPAAPPSDLSVTPAASLPIDPSDAAWDRVPEYVAPLLPQDLVEPRQTKPSTEEVRIRAVIVEDQIAFRLQWKDSSQNTKPGPADFTDACAIQLPAMIEPTLPAPQMGEPGHPVEITFWTAAWQADVDGRGDTLRDLYPNAAVDHYPFHAEPLKKDPAAQREFETRYSPARAAGNSISGPRQKAVEDLVAEGPGTLSPAPTSNSQGRGQRVGDSWSVVIARHRPDGLTPAQNSQVAFAVWDGGCDEVGARKMRTGWISLNLQAEAQR